jgi:hypothetical protein
MLVIGASLDRRFTDEPTSHVFRGAGGSALQRCLNVARLPAAG